jgi:hypothetical protein
MSHANGPLQRLLERLALVCLLAAFVIHAIAIRREAAGVDEFEHLHAAWLVAHGHTPFTDFFEHHTPLFYLLGAQFLPRHNSTYDTVLNLRFVALGFTGLMIACGWLWLRRISALHGALAVILLSANTSILTLSHVTFLDVYAAPFLVASALLFGNGRGRPSVMLASGFTFGIAVLFNLKASMGIFAPIVLSISWLWVSRKSWATVRSWISDNLAYMGGGALAIILIVTLLGHNGSVGLWKYTVILNLGWRARHSGMPWLLDVLWQENFVALAAGLFIVNRLIGLRRRAFLLDGNRDMPWLSFSSLVAGVFILPVVWSEYFSTLAPFMALTGAVALGDWFQRWKNRDGEFGESRTGRADLLALVLIGFVTLFPYRTIYYNELAALVQSLSFVPAFGALSVWIARTRAAAPGMRLQLAVCLTLISAVPLLRVATVLHRMDNSTQRAHFEYVMAHTQPSDAVFDGYTGYGVFRPHAYFYWFLHEEVQAMLTEEEKGVRLINALETQRPPIVIVDQWVATLPSSVSAYLTEKYEKSPLPGILRRKPDSPDAASR